MIQNLLIALLCLTPFSADKVEIIKENGMSVIHLIGNVVIEDDETRIVCEDARLYEEEDCVTLKDSVVISDKDGSIYAHHAQYYFSDNKGYLGGGVELFSGVQIIRADSLFYDGAKQYVEMHRNVVIEDTSNNMIGYGGMGWYDLREDRGYLERSPRLELQREGKDPIDIRALRFELLAEDDMFYGYESVIARIDSITVECDTFSFDLASDSGTMIRPRVAEKLNRLNGEAGRFSMRSDEIESFSVYDGDSEYRSEEGNINNVEGDTIIVFFEHSEAVRIVVEGSPHGVLQLKRGPDDIEN
jgi:lipopolysaccharide export system protein LptA